MDRINNPYLQAILDFEAREHRWQQKHGPIDFLAGFYLRVKPAAVARGRLTPQRIEEIERILAFPFSGNHTEADLEEVGNEVGRLSEMEGVDCKLKDVFR